VRGEEGRPRCSSKKTGFSRKTGRCAANQKKEKKVSGKVWVEQNADGGVCMAFRGGKQGRPYLGGEGEKALLRKKGVLMGRTGREPVRKKKSPHAYNQGDKGRENGAGIACLDKRKRAVSNNKITTGPEKRGGPRKDFRARKKEGGGNPRPI